MMTPLQLPSDAMLAIWRPPEVLVADPTRDSFSTNKREHVGRSFMADAEETAIGS